MKVWVCSASYQLKDWGWGGGVITSLYAPEVHQCPLVLSWSSTTLMVVRREDKAPKC